MDRRLERGAAKAEHIKMMREQMRQDAIRTNMEEAERHRKEKEAAVLANKYLKIQIFLQQFLCPMK